MDGIKRDACEWGTLLHYQVQLELGDVCWGEEISREIISLNK